MKVAEAKALGEKLAANLSLDELVALSDRFIEDSRDDVKGATEARREWHAFRDDDENSVRHVLRTMYRSKYVQRCMINALAERIAS